MPPKTIKKKSSAKRESPRRMRSAGTTPRRRAVPSAEEELFAKAFRSSPYPIGITELETGCCLEVNDACLEIFGFRRDEVVGKTTLMLGIWPDPQERVRFIDRLKSEGTVRNLEVSMRMKDGELRQFIISTDLITLGGKPCLLTIGNDITERKRVEAALRQNEERWQLAATGTTDGIWDWDVAGHTVFLSMRWKQLRGFREEEIGSDETEWSSRIHPEDSSRVMATVQSYFNKEMPAFHCEYRTRRKDGTYYWVIDRGIAVWDEHGQVIRMVGSETDITERKRAEEALSRIHDELERRIAERTAKLGSANERLQAEITERNRVQEVLRARSAELQITLDTAATGLVRNSRDLRYRWANVAYAKLVGRRVEDIVGRTLDDVLGAEGIAKIRPYIDRVLRGERVEFETELPISGRGLRWLHVVYMPDLDTAGDVLGWVGSITDITKRKQAEDAVLEKQRELQQSQAQLQDLTAKLFRAQDGERQRIARDLHDDFSQRLGALVLDMESLQRDPPLSPELIGKALEPVREELTQLTEDLHNLAYKLHPPLLQSVGLQAAIEDSIHKAMERTGLQIILKAKHLPSSIPQDWSTCLFRVFQESLQNVAKHAKATEVMVKLNGSSKGIGLSVLDNGKGFAERDKDGHQNGLGLTSMRERLRLVNGFLNIHSRPADGTKVCAWIPFQEKTW